MKIELERFFFLLRFCRGKMKVPGPHSWLLDMMCHYRNRKCWLSLQVRNRQLTQKRLLKYLPQKLKGIFAFPEVVLL